MIRKVASSLLLMLFILCSAISIMRATNIQKCWQESVSTILAPHTEEELSALEVSYPEAGWAAFQQAESQLIMGGIEGSRNSKASVLLFHGMPDSIAHFPMTAGRMPVYGESNVCALDKNTAFKLFSSVDVVGSNVNYDGNDWMIVGILDMADRTLIECLKGAPHENTPVAPSVDSISFSDDVEGALLHTEYILEGQLSLRLDRVWNARSVSPTIATDPMELKEPSDSSNSLLALDGEIANLSGIGMEVSTMLRASLRVNAVTYSCTVQCEKDRGAAFGSTLLPMGKSRLVILCEIPEGLELTSVELDMDVAAGSEEYSLCFY